MNMPQETPFPLRPSIPKPIYHLPSRFFSLWQKKKKKPPKNQNNNNNKKKPKNPND
jgi:hypothetical protein